MSVAVEPAWRVHLSTADVTCARFACARREERDPWPLTRVISSLLALGAEREDRPHAVGSGRGIPLIHRQDMTWRGCALALEAHHAHDSLPEEVSMTLPSWDELVRTLDTEDAVWELVDTVAASADALHGAMGDGEALDPRPAATAVEWTARLGRHIALLLPASDATTLDGGVACAYRVLPQSGLSVVLR